MKSQISRLVIIFILFLALMDTAMAAGETIGGGTTHSVKVSTYYDEPETDIKKSRVRDALIVGDGGTGDSASFFGTVSVKNNLYGGWEANSKGGWLAAQGDLAVWDPNQYSGYNFAFLATNKASNGVSMGTAGGGPGGDYGLSIWGEAKAMIVHAFSDPENNASPYAEMYVYPNAWPRVDGNLYARFSAVGNSRYGVLHLDGDPLVFETQDKGPGITQALSRGQVVVNGVPDNSNPNLILVVGNPGYPAGYVFPPEARANDWGPHTSSRANKTDIISLTETNYRQILSKLQAVDVVWYHYKNEGRNNKRSIGFLAEDAPEDIRCGQKMLSLSDEACFLLAAAKGLKMENDELKKRVEKLKK